MWALGMDKLLMDRAWGRGGEGTTGMGMVGARQHCDLMDRQVKPTAD